MSDVETYSRIVEEARPEIERKLRERLVEDVTESMQWKAKELLVKEVGKFVEKEIAPEVGKYLKSEKGPILEAVLESAKSISVTLAAGMTSKVAENLNTSWSSKKIMEALFK